MNFKRLIRCSDITLGGLFFFETHGFTAIDGFISEGRDTMNIKEWESYRTIEMTDSDSTTNWLKLIAGKEQRKFLIFSELVEKIPRNLRLLDFGCGQGHVGVLFSLAGYNVSFSDYTNLVIPAKLNWTKHNFFCADFKSFNNFSEFDVILLTQVDYIFNKSEITDFLGRAKAHGCRVIFVTTQVFGPLGYFWSLINLPKRKLNPGIKFHGWMRTIGIYRRIGNKLGFKVSVRNFNNEALNTCYMLDFQNA